MESDRSLQAILFTDIVNSTARAAELGDRPWRALLRRHHGIVRRQLGLFKGREVATAGDGFLATFDKPADAILCACAIRDGVRDIGLEIRSGLHMGGVAWEEKTVGGIAVHIGARVAAEAGAGEVLVSSTVRELEEGSGFGFVDRGAHSLKGVPGEWRLFAVTGVPSLPEAGARRRWLPRAARGDGILWGAGAFVILALVSGLYVGLRPKNRDAGRDRLASVARSTTPAPAAGNIEPRTTAPDSEPGARSGPAIAPATEGLSAPVPGGAPAESAGPAPSGGVEGGREPSDSAAAGAATSPGSRAAAPAAVAESAASRGPDGAAYDDGRAAAERARRAAREAGAPALAPKAYGAAESLRAAASTAAASGRYGEAIDAIRRAARGYEGALAEARLRSQLVSARDSLRALREAADPSATGYDEAVRLEGEAQRAERAGQTREALADLRKAAVAYRAVARPPEVAKNGPTPAAERPPAQPPPTAERPPAEPPPTAEPPRAAPTEFFPAPVPTPAPAPPQAPPPKAAPAEAPEVVVRGVLDEMRRAIEAEDLDGLRRTWVGLAPDDAKSFRQWFDRVRQIQVGYQVRSTTRDEDRIVTTLQTTYKSFNESTNRHEDQSFQQVLEIAQRGGRWVVVASR